MNTGRIEEAPHLRAALRAVYDARQNDGRIVGDVNISAALKELGSFAAALREAQAENAQLREIAKSDLADHDAEVHNGGSGNFFNLRAALAVSPPADEANH